MEGLAKTSESVNVAPVVHPSSPLSTTSAGEMLYSGVPVDMYAHFGIDLGKATSKEKERMGYVYSKLEGETLGDKMLKLKDIEYNLGRAGFDSMLDKVNRYIRLGDEIKELEKRRNALER